MAKKKSNPAPESQNEDKDELELKVLREAGWEDEVKDGTGGDDAEFEAAKEKTKTEEAVYSDEWIKNKVEEMGEKEELKEVWKNRDKVILTDSLAACFEPNPALLNCKDEDRSAFFAGLINSKDFEELHFHTEMNLEASTMAALAIAASCEEAMKATSKVRAEVKKGAMKNKGKEAAKEALAEAECMNEMGESTGGLANSTNQNISIRSMVERMKQLKNHKSLMEILKRAGKFQRIASQMQQFKKLHQEDEVAGVKLDGRIDRLIGAEMARLNDETMEAELMRRIIEKKALCLEMSKNAEEARGPIIMAIDESGSMHGDRILEAKAAGLAVAWVARKQKRDVIFVSWASCNQQTKWVVKKGVWSETALSRWASHFFSGGTDFPSLILWDIVQKAEIEKGKTDLILVTDGQFGCVNKENVMDWKREAKARIISLAVDTEITEELQSISDKAFSISKWSAAEEGIQEMFSV